MAKVSQVWGVCLLKINTACVLNLLRFRKVFVNCAQVDMFVFMITLSLVWLLVALS